MFENGSNFSNLTPTLEERIASHYPELSVQLRKAADFAVSNPLDVASKSLRSISDQAEVSPATFSRLARALGLQSFDEMKELTRAVLDYPAPSFSQKAQRLQTENPTGSSVLEDQSSACIENIRALSQKIETGKLEAAATSLRNAEQVLLFGALGSTGIVEYLAYLARFFAPNWSLAGRMGASVGATTANLRESDAVLIVTKTPYATRAVALAKLARDAGADVILITDHHQCPALAFATHLFIVPSESPQFFSSYAATLVLIEALIATIVASTEVDVAASIRRVEEQNQALGEYWAE